jgi:WD40 repeat protein
VKVLNHFTEVHCVMIRQNLIVSGGSDTVIKLWSLNGTETASLKGSSQSVYWLTTIGHRSNVKGIDLRSSTLASASEDKTVKVW